MYAIIGCHIKEYKKFFNAALLINRKGNVEYIYRKQNLFAGLEQEKTISGTSNRVVQTDFGKIGLILCWDFAFPEQIRIISKNGAELIFCPSFLMNEANIPSKVFESYPLIRSFENLCYFVSCDACNEEVFGKSYICSPFKILKCVDSEGLIVQTLDLDEVSVWRRHFMPDFFI